MKYLYIAIIFTFSSILGSHAQNISEEMIENGIRYNQEGKYLDAIDEFSTIILQYPSQNPDVYRHRGYSYYYSKRYELAISDFEKAQELAPGKTDASFALAKIYYLKRDYQLSLQYFNQELEFNPDNARAFNDRGMVKCQIRDYDSAFDDFTSAFSIDSSFAMAYNNAGAAKYYNQDIDNPIRKDIEIAKSYFTKSLELDPTLALAYRNRGAMNMFLDLYDEALHDLKIAGKLQPKEAVIPFYRAIVLKAKGEPNAAINELNKSIILNPNFQYAYEEIADIHMNKASYDDALDYYKKAISKTPSSNEIYKGLMYYKMAIIYAKNENKSKVYAQLNTAKKFNAFKDKKVYQKFLKESAFSKYRSEKKFRKFTKSVTKIKKEYKFLNSELRWFRMND